MGAFCCYYRSRDAQSEKIFLLLLFGIHRAAILVFLYQLLLCVSHHELEISIFYLNTTAPNHKIDSD